MSRRETTYEPSVVIAIALALYGHNVSPQERAEAIYDHFAGECAEMYELVTCMEHYGSAPTSLAFPSAEVYVQHALARYGEEARRRVQIERCGFFSRQPRLFEPEVPIPEELREAVDLWLAYQREQWRFTYKPLGFAQLLERMAEMGPERAMAAVKWSMGGSGHPYKGLFEPPAGGRLKSFQEMNREAMVRELMAPGFRAEAPAFEIEPRLAALASAIPQLPALDEAAARVSHLYDELCDREPLAVETALGLLDSEMLAAATASLNDEQEREMADSVEKTLKLLRGRGIVIRLGDREMLFRQVLRRILHLPVLSLFSPEAEP